MMIDSRINGGILILTVQGQRIDAAGAVVFKEEIRKQTENFEGRVVLDMERVEFLDSSGLGALVSIMKLLNGDTPLELARCGNIVQKVLNLTRMDRVFILHDTVPEPDTDQDAA